MNPVLAFANYVLDSLGMDAFRKHSGLLQEALVSTYVRSSDDAGAAAGGGITFADPSIPGNIKQEWSYKALPGLKQYYTAIHDGDEIDLEVKGGNDKGKARASNVAKALDEVLEDYLGCLEEDSTFTLPVSGMRIVPFLQSLTRSGCVSMLISDKGTLVRTRTDEVSVLSRNTQGVRLIKLSQEDERLVGVERIAETDDEELDSEGNPIVADESPEEGQQGQEGESAGDE